MVLGYRFEFISHPSKRLKMCRKILGFQWGICGYIAVFTHNHFLQLQARDNGLEQEIELSEFEDVFIEMRHYVRSAYFPLPKIADNPLWFAFHPVGNLKTIINIIVGCFNIPGTRKMNQQDPLAQQRFVQLVVTMGLRFKVHRLVFRFMLCGSFNNYSNRNGCVNQRVGCKLCR